MKNIEITEAISTILDVSHATASKLHDGRSLINAEDIPLKYSRIKDRVVAMKRLVDIFSVTDKKIPLIVTQSSDSYQLLVPILGGLDVEKFAVILLNRANRHICTKVISVGGIAGTVVDAKVLFSLAIKYKACAVILGHNHPSGNLYPSQADKELTKKLKEGGKLLDIKVLDHIIIGGPRYLSMADESLL